MRNDLMEIYKIWRELQAEVDAETDCGEGIVREDFSRFAVLDEEISFEDMLKLERAYE